MTFLKRLFGGTPSFEDRVWKTSGRRLDDAVRRIASDARNDDVTCLAVYHFSESGERLRQRLEAEGLLCAELDRPGQEQLEQLPARPGAAAVSLLHSVALPEEIKRGQGRRSERVGTTPCHVHLTEHYPLPYRDQHVLNLAAILPEKSAFFGYAALDEPWLARALGRQARQLLEQLGVSDAEVLDHGMISRALSNAQAELGRKLKRSEQHADSLEDWALRNLSG